MHLEWVLMKKRFWPRKWCVNQSYENNIYTSFIKNKSERKIYGLKALEAIVIFPAITESNAAYGLSLGQIKNMSNPEAHNLSRFAVSSTALGAFKGARYVKV